MMYNWLSDFVNGKDVSDIANQQWAGQYTETIARCITNMRLWIGINVKTGTVELLTSPKSGLLMVHSETPIEIWNRLPQELRSYLIGQLDMFMRNSKGCYLLSKLERKMVYQFLTYISQIVFLFHTVFIGGFMANLYDRVMEKKEDLAYCMYYFVVFDHGLSRMAKLLNRLLNSEEVDHGDILLVKSCVTLLVNGSIEMGAETKADWENTVEKCNPEIWKEVMFALSHIKSEQKRKGNTSQPLPLCFAQQNIGGVPVGRGINIYNQMLLCDTGEKIEYFLSYRQKSHDKREPQYSLSNS